MPWDSFETASPIDRDAFLFMGADPAWTPDREFKAADADDAAEGECSLCGGDGAVLTDEGGDPATDAEGRVILVSCIPDGSRRVCARCGRYGRDRVPRSMGYSQPTISEPPDDGNPVACEDDPGYVERDGVKVPEKYARLMKG
ncbi:hypothetical protein [Singulisphaera sp. PoT]|uniref:hypothetical protein n=1 Tax=Singulisphaera sp. PoT TaxID=3411797 RepID=UPI003BF50214